MNLDFFNHELMYYLTCLPSFVHGLVQLVSFLLGYCLIYFFSKSFILSFLKSIISKSENKFDDIFLDRKVFDRLAYLPVFYVMHETISFLSFSSGNLSVWFQRLILASIILVLTRVFSAFVSSLLDIGRTLPMLKNHPLTSYGQVFKIGVYSFSLILIVSTLLGESPWVLLSGLGALTAVLMMVFKDVILGLVSSIQLSANDLIRIGDWIEMPKYQADGDVIEVNLNTVKVRNFDKTISTIPTHAITSDSFKNWRGMFESGGRRIKRSLFLDMHSVRFCTDSDLIRFQGNPLLADYIQTKVSELNTFNANYSSISSFKLRQLTNLGTFRAYIEFYLRTYPSIHQYDKTFLVRQLPPSSDGIGLEIYVFTKTTDWKDYESIQADIFDHLLSKVKDFDLRLFQNPSAIQFVKNV